jgi:hypothetical protein
MLSTTMADRPVVYVAIPTKHEVEAPCMVSVLELVTGLGAHEIGAVFRHEDMSGLAIARSLLGGTFRAHARATHLLFIDSDVCGYSAGDVARMVHSGHDVIGGPVPSRSLDVDTLYSAVKEGVPKSEIHRYLSPLLMKRLPGGKLHIRGDALEVDAIGTGFLLISRAAIERMIADLPIDAVARVENRADLLMLFDYATNEHGELVGEDYGFCARWRALGGAVWADTRIALTHIGRQAFQAAPLEESMGIAAERARRMPTIKPAAEG